MYGRKYAIKFIGCLTFKLAFHDSIKGQKIDQSYDKPVLQTCPYFYMLFRHWQYFLCKLDAYLHNFLIIKMKNQKLYKLKEIGCAQYFIK